MFTNSPVVYDGRWPELFKIEADRVRMAANSVVVRIDHIGSTAVAGLSAKPILDILVEVKVGRLAELAPALVSYGFTSKGENGIAGRSYFSRAATAESLAVHHHAFESGHAELAKHLAFRDYLRAHRDVTRAYDALKNEILARPEITRDAYQDLKSKFVSDTSVAALAWYLKRVSENPKALKAPKRKAVVYAMRERAGRREVLVFDHAKFPDVSPQVPSGSVERGEDVLDGALREFIEESGAALKTKLRFLGSYVYYKPHIDKFQERFHFNVEAGSLPDQWTHFVTGEGSDRDLEFRYYWMDVRDAAVKLQIGLGDGLKYFGLV